MLDNCRKYQYTKLSVLVVLLVLFGSEAKAIVCFY